MCCYHLDSHVSQLLVVLNFLHNLFNGLTSRTTTIACYLCCVHNVLCMFALHVFVLHVCNDLIVPSSAHICNAISYIKKGAAPVHLAPACARSGEGSDHLNLLYATFPCISTRGCF